MCISYLQSNWYVKKKQAFSLVQTYLWLKQTYMLRRMSSLFKCIGRILVFSLVFQFYLFVLIYRCIAHLYLTFNSVKMKFFGYKSWNQNAHIISQNKLLQLRIYCMITETKSTKLLCRTNGTKNCFRF